MDTVVLLSPLLLRHPSSLACRLRLLRKQRSIVDGAARRRPTSRSCRSRLRRSPSASSSAAGAAASTEPQPQKKDKDLVFVAGATGRVGSRAVRELIKQGFRVRAAVRNAQSQRAASLVQSVKQMKLDDDDAAAATSSAAADQKLEIVECDLEKQPQEGLVAAIGNASLVVCSIGASEKDILDVTGPYRIDYMATNNLVQAAAAAAKVEHFILVTSLGTNRIGFPAFLLNLFWGVLYWKRRAEEALMASGIPYTIIRPGGMERPTDAFKETHNLVLAAEDTYVGGLVSNLQVAELIGCMAKNRRAAYCKVVEVVAETTAPLLSMEQLLDTVPSKRERELPPAEEETLLTAKAPSSSSSSSSDADNKKPQVEEAAASASDKGGSTGTAASSTTASSSPAPPLLDSNDAK